MRKLAVLLCFCIVFNQSIVIQADNGFTWEVYVEQSIDDTGLDRLSFINVLTGEITNFEIYGERYTPIDNRVLYYDYIANQVMQITPDGTNIPHPFIQMDLNARRIDWVVSTDARTIAWTLTYGTNDALTTISYMATAEGANRREVLRDGPLSGLRAFPVAFSLDNSILYMDTQPDGIGRFVAYTQYAGLYALDIATGDVIPLPDEPACFCGAGIRADKFLRLRLTDDLNGFDVNIYDLATDLAVTISALRLTNYTQAGDILISPDGTLAVYALSQIEEFATPNQRIETVFMLVDLLGMTQATLTSPITTYVHPVAWTENNTAIIFTSPQLNGTWKINLTDGALVKVANVNFIGTLQD